MKNFVSLIIFTIVFSNSLAQEKFIEYSLGSNAINNTNYSYKIYFSTEEGVYYYNKKAIESYLANIEAMEKLTRLNTNLALLKKHQKQVFFNNGKIIN